MSDIGILILMFFSYTYCDAWIFYIASKNLGRKYSLKSTVVVTFGIIVLKYILKFVPMMLWGNQLAVILSPLILFINIVFIEIMFKTSFMNKIVYATIIQVVAVCMDMIGLNVTTLLVGEFAFLKADHLYTPVVVLISNIFIGVGFLGIRFLWELVAKIDWKSFRYQWLCIFLPISQYAFLSQTGFEYVNMSKKLPIIVWIGIFLGIVADIYMFVLFYHSGQRAKAEKELKYVEQQYRLERLHYEHLLKNQEEISKMRHDFQNYLLTIKQVK